VIASGRQYFSWITLDDLVSAILFALDNESLKGPVNAVTPHPVTNREFTKTLGRVLGRPTIFPMPAFAARLAFGEMADEKLIGGVKVSPHELVKAGFPFEYPELEPALQHLLK
jgi:NAD dependent epimerase/dehydratase family enzyme